MQNKNSKSLFGVDINEYTQSVDFAKLSTTVDFLYLRSSGSATGKFRVDKKFLDFSGKARENKIPVGAYHFGVPSYDLQTADEQCDYFIGILEEGFGEKDYGDLFPVLDIEAPTDRKISTKALIGWIERFKKRFEEKTRRRLMLYTGVFFVELYNDFKLSEGYYPLKNMPLWIAMYTNIPYNPPFPPDLGGWKKWRMWQYSEAAIVNGVGNPCDANWGPDDISLLIEPKEVQGLSATKADNLIKINWTKNTDMDLLGYNLFVNGYWIGTVDNPKTNYEFNIHELPFEAKGPLKVSIEAFDYDGEASQKRASVMI